MRFNNFHSDISPWKYEFCVSLLFNVGIFMRMEDGLWFTLPPFPSYMKVDGWRVNRACHLSTCSVFRQLYASTSDEYWMCECDIQSLPYTQTNFFFRYGVPWFRSQLYTILQYCISTVINYLQSKWASGFWKKWPEKYDCTVFLIKWRKFVVQCTRLGFEFLFIKVNFVNTIIMKRYYYPTFIMVCNIIQYTIYGIEQPC